ncbi:DNA-3-methyladenine glycosylase [Ligilactobacillus saerimneri]|uniref:Putative 3-methyladenine DNA glycosylase n=1 Tax=Ligilactobacillus saerimneri TaxID=228229 RepID=A0A7H9EMJ0_9LACO|nr:DNA-3-methyladenine glycosylase [Ligilactobacillus saerimneri]QLL78731.1 DNA-3-methyladenine glycosylase [Ligilactobacillus saerimneri]
MLTPYQKFFTGRPTPRIAQDLLGTTLYYHGPKGTVGGLIVETEAYLGENDSASHAYNGRRTAYTESLYGLPGTIYLYQIRGHYCLDIAVQAQDVPHGVLIRGLEPCLNPEQMAANRRQTGFAISNGPAKLVQALGINSRKLDGQPLENNILTIDIARHYIPREIAVSSRIGVNLNKKDGNAPLRFYVQGNPYVSQMRKRDMDLSKHGWD